MLTTRLYEDCDKDMVAVVLEDGEYSNYVPCPMIAAMDGESFLEEARLGFPDALPYQFDGFIGLTMKEAAAQAERDGTLIAEVGEEIILYPRRMSQDQQEMFEIELGDAWQELLEQASGDEGVRLEI